MLNETLVIRGRQSGKWSFPKGHGEYRETPLDACVRELREETGIDMKGIVPDDEIRFNSGTYFVYFVNERLDLQPQDTKEVEDIMWVALHRLPYLIGNKDLKSFYRTVNVNTLLDRMYREAAVVS